MALMHLLYFDEIQAFKTCMNDAIMIIIMKNSNGFQVHRCIECMRNWRLRRTKSHLGCRPPKDEAAFSVKGTVYNSQ